MTLAITFCSIDLPVFASVQGALMYRAWSDYEPASESSHRRTLLP
jgi:hypothetical protein